MRRKLFSIAVMATIVVAAGWNIISQNKNEVRLTDWALDNMEALASGEESISGTLYGNSSGSQFCCCSGSNSCAASHCGGC